MNRKFILIGVLFLGIALTGCKNTNKQNRNSGNVTEQDESISEYQPKNTPSQIYGKPEIPVLCYHRITNGLKSEYAISPATFAAHIKILADSGYHSVSPAELYGYLVYNKALPEKPVMITFDDSRVEHYTIAAPILKKNGFRGAFFIMTITYNKKNYMTKEQIAQLVKDGHTVGLHSWDHTMVTKYKTTDDWQKQVTEPKKKLETIVGKKVEYWAYPNGVFDHKGAEELSKYFKISFSLSTKRDSLLPLQTVRRIIVPECSPEKLLKSMHRSFVRTKITDKKQKTI
jgi:peptidoglycan/xylan/chitin deacetylase (PgdA/CDA1 family)